MPIIVNKKIAETPLEVINRVRKAKNISNDTPMTYAGRLDPAASGLLIILEDREVFEKEKYLKLDKEYETEFIFGLATDTGDLFGVLENISQKQIDKKSIEDKLRSFIGQSLQSYPIYSSKTQNGKQLHTLANQKLINKNNAPKHLVSLFAISDLDFDTIESKDVKEKVHFLLKNIKGDFRYKEIKESWERLEDREFLLIKFQLKCSSGFYIRQLAIDLGDKLEIPTLVYSINRTAIGHYKKVNFGI